MGECVIRCDIYAFTLWPFILPVSHSSHHFDSKALRLERLWLCDVKCGQGVPGLVLTTEQGSVFVPGPIWLDLYSGTTCLAEPKSKPQRGSEYGKNLWKSKQHKAVFWILVEPSCLKVVFSAFKFCTEGCRQTHCTLIYSTAINTIIQAVCPLCTYI